MKINPACDSPSQITYAIARTYQPPKPGSVLSLQNAALGSVGECAALLPFAVCSFSGLPGRCRDASDRSCLLFLAPVAPGTECPPGCLLIIHCWASSCFLSPVNHLIMVFFKTEGTTEETRWDGAFCSAAFEKSRGLKLWPGVVVYSLQTSVCVFHPPGQAQHTCGSDNCVF